MGRWLSNISLKYKFWAVNAVAFITTLLLVLYALQIEQHARADDAQAFQQAQQHLLAAWPAGQPAPDLPSLAGPPSFDQLLAEHAGQYAIAVFVLMLIMLGASQLLIRFLLTHLNALKDVMLHVERSGDLSSRRRWPAKTRSGKWPRRSMPCRRVISASSARWLNRLHGWIKVRSIWPRA